MASAMSVLCKIAELAENCEAPSWQSCGGAACLSFLVYLVYAVLSLFSLFEDKIAKMKIFLFSAFWRVLGRFWGVLLIFVNFK